MKKLKSKTYVKILKCRSKRHEKQTGHIHSTRLDGSYNVVLKSSEHCVVKKVKVLYVPTKPVKVKEVKPVPNVYMYPFLNWRIF